MILDNVYLPYALKVKIAKYGYVSDATAEPICR